MDGDSSHFTKILANLTAGTSKDDALKAMGASAKQEGDQIRLYCPQNTHYVFATISNDKVTSSGLAMRLQNTRLLLLVQLLTLAGGSHADASGVFNPVDIMEDMYETPRFQIQMLDELVPDSKLSTVLSELRSAAKAAERRQATQSESDPPSAVTSADIIYDPIVARAGRKWKFLCQIPRVTRNATIAKPAAIESDDEAKQKNEETITRGLELLQPLRDNCITHTTGWWTFEYCHDRMVRQYHRMAPDSHGHAAEIEYRLGEYSHRKQRTISAAQEPVEQATQIRRIGRKHFLTQVWAGGTLCDITRQPREVEVQFHCDANSPERIAHVEEVAVCQYVVVINTPRLCVDPGFYDTVASKVYDIKCQHVVSDAEAEEREQMLRLEAEDEDDDTVPLDMLGKLEVVSAVSAEQAPQIVVSLNDPNLVKASHQDKDMVRRVLALAYGDMHLNVEFSEPSNVANKVANEAANKVTKDEVKEAANKVVKKQVKETASEVANEAADKVAKKK
ncbi:Protein OS-9 [Coemansia sp. RSA 2167]|nr:Protein OS-9 [Coemansia sp. RSA 2167]KAJ2153331.1 Protein OS-9 [Coemansia sp. RSA 637]KAJ2428482.1 Protein OS-9 [Coemansia sp. RSA 2524]KAJ2535664.1 Protein OS-9 [Coemansia sp. RSA 1935]KAJ2650777.1 Protein OS-9 [Coemansia sp. RSA 1287]